MDYFIDAIRKYFDFKGFSLRKEYWVFVLFSMLFMIPLVIIDALIKMEILAPLYQLAILIPSISIAVRRLHDTGRSGWWLLILIIPLVGAIVLLYLLCQKSNADSLYRADRLIVDRA